MIRRPENCCIPFGQPSMNGSPKSRADAGLLELRAELAGQWSDAKAQVADYTAAIEALAQQKPEAAAADLKRLYGRRGNAHRRLAAVATGGRRLRPCRDRRDNRRGLAIQPGTGTGRGAPYQPGDGLCSSRSKPNPHWARPCPSLPDDSILASGENPLNDAVSRQPTWRETSIWRRCASKPSRTPRCPKWSRPPPHRPLRSDVLEGDRGPPRSKAAHHTRVRECLDRPAARIPIVRTEQWNIGGQNVRARHGRNQWDSGRCQNHVASPREQR